MVEAKIEHVKLTVTFKLPHKKTLSSRALKINNRVSVFMRPAAF